MLTIPMKERSTSWYPILPPGTAGSSLRQLVLIEKASEPPNAAPGVCLSPGQSRAWVHTA